MSVKCHLACTFVLWALTVSPAMCTGGFLEHGCGCEPALTCSGESGCAFDPCETLHVRCDEQSSEVELARDCVSIFALRAGDEDIPLWRWWYSAAEPPPRFVLPFPPSDIPLLI